MAAQTPSQQRREQARDERRQQLMQAARKVFSEKGFHAATVDDITRAAGVAKGTFYLYFSEKRHVFYALIEQFFELLTRAGQSVSREVHSSREYFERVKQAARTLASIFADNRDLVRLTYRESMGLDETLERMVRGFYRQIARIEADNLRLGCELGLLRADIDPLLAAYAHIGMVERVLLTWTFDREAPALPDMVEQLIELAHHGVAQRSS